MKVTIIIPTYNEVDNIRKLVPALEKEFEKIPHDMRILVVDDHSPDHTANAVRDLMKIHPNLELLEGEKQGLGAAYIRGFLYAMNRMNSDVVFEMDADFSHDPKDVPRLMAEIEKGADFVIGSRYVEGGSIPSDWGLWRKANSFFGNVAARYIAGMYRIRDCTAGFRAIRTSLLQDIDLEELGVQGYAFQVALLHEAYIRKARIVEIPVDFVDRTVGDSKLGFSDIIEFLRNVFWIRLQTHATFVKFLIVGASGVVVNLGLFALLLHFGVNKYLASPIAIEASIISNFIFNNIWTFRWRNVKAGIKVRGLKFNTVSLLSLGVSYTTFLLISMAFPGVSPLLAQFLGIIPGTMVNYLLNSYWTFKHEPS